MARMDNRKRNPFPAPQPTRPRGRSKSVVSERKRAEERLLESQQWFTVFMENLPGFAWMKDAEGRYVYVNKRLEQLEPYRNGWRGKVDADLWPLEIAAQYRANDQKVISSRETLQAVERYVVNGEQRYVLVSKFPVWDRTGVVVFVGGVSVDITERKHAEEERRELYERLQASHDGLRVLARQLLEVQEEERRHLACELHDEIGQALTAAKINLQQAMDIPASPETWTHLEESVKILDRTLQQVRNLSLDLRPSLLDDLGLAPTLKWMADRHAQASGITITFSSDMENVRFPVGVELACYRIAQEALTNAIRHAHATRISIAMVCSGSELMLTVRDDGVGFDLNGMLTRAREGKSAGLLGILERVSLLGGQLDIQSRHGSGTQIHTRFPLIAPHMPDASHP